MIYKRIKGDVIISVGNEIDAQSVIAAWSGQHVEGVPPERIQFAQQMLAWLYNEFVAMGIDFDKSCGIIKKVV